MNPERARRLANSLFGLVPFAVAGMVLLWQSNCSPTATAPVAPRVSHISARACAIRTVYHNAQDDWGQRALIAASVLNRSPAPGAVIPCPASPFPAEDGAGGTSYRYRAARDAVDAVASGSYDLPRSCIGVVAFAPPEAAPRSQCITGGLAFITPASAH